MAWALLIRPYCKRNSAPVAKDIYRLVSELGMDGVNVSNM
jgi:hypothetical protein